MKKSPQETCPQCSGFGYRIHVQFVRYSNGRYRHEWREACATCAGSGVVAVVVTRKVRKAVAA